MRLERAVEILGASTGGETGLVVLVPPTRQEGKTGKAQIASRQAGDDLGMVEAPPSDVTATAGHPGRDLCRQAFPASLTNHRGGQGPSGVVDAPDLQSQDQRTHGPLIGPGTQEPGDVRRSLHLTCDRGGAQARVAQQGAAPATTDAAGTEETTYLEHMERLRRGCD